MKNELHYVKLHLWQHEYQIHYKCNHNSLRWQ